MTSDQNQTLFRLMEDCSIEKLKPILYSAIPKWISGEVVPKQNDYGIRPENELLISGSSYKYKFFNKPDMPKNSACLLGTALVTENATLMGVAHDLRILYNLTNFEILTIERSFDNHDLWFEGYTDDENEIKNLKEIYNYVSEIRKVIFGK